MGERAYSGTETGINAAWTSDLKSAWADRADTPVGSGETVGGTTVDDFHDTRTSLLPRHLHQEDLTPLQTKIIEAAVSRSQATALDVAQASGASAQWVETVIGEYLPEHPAGVAPEPDTHPDQVRLTDFANGESPVARDNQGTDTARDTDGRDRRTAAKQAVSEQRVELERFVPDGYDTTGKTIQKQYTTCGDSSCHCTESEGHGPYLYAYWHEDDTLHKEYIGKPVAPEET